MSILHILADKVTNVVAPKADASAVIICGCYSGWIKAWINGRCRRYRRC